MPLTRHLLICIFFFISATGWSQFKNGDKMVGVNVGSVLYNSGKSTVTFPSFQGYKTSSSSYAVRFEPNIGWFISDETAVGGTVILHLHGQKVRYENNGTAFQEDRSAYFDVGLGAFVRHYFGNSGNFFPFGQAGFNLGISTGTTEGFRYYDATPDYKNTYDGEMSGGFFMNGSIQLGLTKKLNPHTGLDFYIGYTYSYNKNTFLTNTATDVDLDGDIDFTSENEPTTKFTNHGFIFGVGFQIFLTRNK